MTEQTTQDLLRAAAERCNGYHAANAALMLEAAAQLAALTAERDRLIEAEGLARGRAEAAVGARDELQEHVSAVASDNQMLRAAEMTAAHNAWVIHRSTLLDERDTALQQCAKGAAKLAAVERFVGELDVQGYHEFACELRAALATPSTTAIRPCPHCGKEGEADAAETELTCPYCGYDWSVPATPSAQESKGAIDPRPKCIRCGKRWVPAEGLDATCWPCDDCYREREASPERGTGKEVPLGMDPRDWYCERCATNEPLPHEHRWQLRGTGRTPLANATNGVKP